MMNTTQTNDGVHFRLSDVLEPDEVESFLVRAEEAGHSPTEHLIEVCFGGKRPARPMRKTEAQHAA